MIDPFLQLHHLRMGRDTFFRMLGKYGLLNKRHRGKPRRTDSNHWMRKYPNLIKEWGPTESDQLWVSDITYLELCDGDACLSLITDAYSRKIVGFHVSDSRRAEGCIRALQMAVAGRSNIEGLIHHSDRGVQYCCGDYLSLLQGLQVGISMAKSGDQRDNAIAEYLRPHSSISMLTPALVHGRKLNFKRQWKNYNKTRQSKEALVAG